MTNKFYGQGVQHQSDDVVSQHVEDVTIRGYTILKDLFTLDALCDWRKRIDDVYRTQEKELSYEAMKSIQDLDMCRAPLLYDFEFMRMASMPPVLEIMQRLLGDWHILNLQNAIINRPNVTHHQSSWHRDLPYQNWVISRPLAISAIFAIDPFSSSTGGTQVLPGSHKNETLPSNHYIDSNGITVEADAGSVIIFDSMLFHRAGYNQSSMTRRAVNHMYTSPILKQQYDFPRAIGMKDGMSAATRKLLGYTAEVPIGAFEWRLSRLKRLQRQQDD